MLKLSVFTFGPFQENTYVLYNDEKEAIIIDPGMYFPQENQKLQSFLDKEGLTPKQLLLTHAHIDHIFGLNWVNEKYGLTPYMHESDQVILDKAVETCAKYGMEIQPYQGAIHLLNEGDIITLGEDKLKILFVPGHSPGSIVFYNGEQEFLIAGDTLFKESIGRTDLPFGNHQELVTHIKNKLLTLPGNTKVFPGHGDATTIEHEIIANPFLL